MNIALIGYMGSGKSIVADILVEKYGYVKYSFGAEVKKIAELILGRKVNKEIKGDRELLQDIGQIFKGQQDEQPHLQYWFESKAFREYYHKNLNDFGSFDYFAKKLTTDSSTSDFHYHFSCGKVVIDDMRFVIEKAYLMKYVWRWFNDYRFMMTFYINSPKELCIERLKRRDKRVNLDWFENQSEKEWGQIGYDYEINNYDYDILLDEIEISKEKLEKEVESLMKWIEEN